MRKRLGPEEYSRLFKSLRNLVDEAEDAYQSGSLALARHATANLAFATNLLHASLREEDALLSNYAVGS